MAVSRQSHSRSQPDSKGRYPYRLLARPVAMPVDEYFYTWNQETTAWDKGDLRPVVVVEPVVEPAPVDSPVVEPEAVVETPVETTPQEPEAVVEVKP